MKQGEDILIHSAAGGVGTTAIQVAKALGANKVYGTIGNERKRAAALDAGADHVICYENCDFAREINNLTAERGVDVILDSLGGGITEASLKCLDYFGRLVIFGNSNGQPGTIEPGSLHASCRSILGFSFGTTRKRRPETLKDTARHVFRLFESGALHINISERLPLSEAAAAHRLIESRKSTGKIVLYT